MKKVVGLLITLSFILLGCAVETTYSISGEIQSIECNDGGRYRSSYITLDNKVTYYADGVIGCKLSEGVKVNIVHNSDLKIRELVVDGTIKNGDNNKDNKQ